MFGFAKQADLDLLNQALCEAHTREVALTRRMKLLEKKLGVTYSEGTKKKPHYKVAGKVGRPKGSKTKKHGGI